MGKTRGKTNNKNKQHNTIKKYKQEFMYIQPYINAINKKAQQTINKQAADSKNNTTYNIANNQEIQKTQTSPNKNKN